MYVCTCVYNLSNPRGSSDWSCQNVIFFLFFCNLDATMLILHPALTATAHTDSLRLHSDFTSLVHCDEHRFKIPLIFVLGEDCIRFLIQLSTEIQFPFFFIFFVFIYNRKSVLNTLLTFLFDSFNLIQQNACHKWVWMHWFGRNNNTKEHKNCKSQHV